MGINIGLFKNRISLEFDYYIKNTDNLIMDKPFHGLWERRVLVASAILP